MKRATNKLIYSTVGVVVLLACVAAVNVISARFYGRYDLTEDKLYTLTDNSRRVISKLNAPIALRFYYSKSNKDMPIFLKNYAREVEDLLTEYQQAGKGNISIVKYDPQPDSDAEDAAMLDGVQGQNLPSGERVYLGLAISCLDETVAIPFLSMDRKNLLEYDITNAITRVATPKKPIIGVMSALPVLGEAPPPMMMMSQNRPEQKDPWVFIEELKKTFEVREVAMDAKTIDTDINLLIVIHPSGIGEETEFAIDQYLMKGGKLAAFLDPKSYFTLMEARSNPGAASPEKASSTFNKLLDAWGVKFDTTLTVGDMEFGRRLEQPRQITFLNVLDITKKGIDPKDIVTAQLNKLTLAFAGFFTGDPAPGLKKTVLLKTTKDAAPVAVMSADNPEQTFRDFKSDNKEYDLAISLTGKFKSAFPNGEPKAKDEKDAKDNKDAPKAAPLKESQKDAVVILVADSDLLIDQLSVNVGNFLGQKLVMMLNDNLNFGQNIADYLCGDRDLIGIRSRETISRPFEKVNALRADAEKQFKERVLALEESLRDTERKLNELQQRKAKDQRFIMSPEQQREVKNFQEKQAEVRKDLKVVRKQLRQDIDALENRLKWLNIALVPAIVITIGLGFGFYRKRRSSAK